jgi:hypothetical protein
VRPLRDVLKQVPTIDITVSVDKLKAGMASSEYQVISGVAMTNLGEEPHLPPKLRETEEAAATSGTEVPAEERKESGEISVVGGEESPHGEEKDDGKRLKEVEGGVGASRGDREAEKKAGQPWASLRLTLDVRSVEAELYTSDTREASLALVQVKSGLLLLERCHYMFHLTTTVKPENPR